MRAYLLYEMLYVSRFLPILGGLAVLLVFGFVDALRELRSLRRRVDLAVAYQNHWISYFAALQRGQGASNDYAWLAEHQAEMTSELGPADRIDYTPPFSNTVVSNYPALANTLVAARGRGAQPEMVALVDHLLISHGGALKHRVNTLGPKLTNPFYLLGRGLRFVLSLRCSCLLGLDCFSQRQLRVPGAAGCSVSFSWSLPWSWRSLRW